MVTIEWPADVPVKINLDAYSDEPRDDVARSSFDQGPTLARNQFTQVFYEMTPQVKMTSVQCELFKEFYHVTLVNGTKPFLMRLLQGGICLGYEVRFRSTYKKNAIGARAVWLTLPIEVRGLDVALSPAMIAAISAWGEDYTILITDGLHALVHVHYPAIMGQQLDYSVPIKSGYLALLEDI